MDQLKILVVEDSPTMRQLIIFALKRLQGAQFDEAGDGVEGLKKIQSTKYDLLICDINMPIMDGLKLVSIARGMPAYKTVPIVIITTEGGSDDKKRALSLGANAYITKPISAPLVQETVKNLLKLK